MAISCKSLQTQMRALADPKIAEHSQRFFKTAKGEYGEGDVFLGIRVSPIRQLAKQHTQISLSAAIKLLHSKYHEERLLAVIILVNKFKKSSATEQKAIYDAYLAHTHLINNWDLVDSSAHQIVGGYLLERNRSRLNRLSNSSSLWERRISIIATLHFIRLSQFEDTLRISRTLLNDQEDLIHKAVGWMLREMGKKEVDVLVSFLDQHASSMPRTMLRYAIEKFEPDKRQHYLKKR